MKSKSTPRSLHRRDFLIRGAATMGAAASLAIAGRANSTPLEAVANQGVPVETKGDSGYRLTPHVQQYYAKARF